MGYQIIGESIKSATSIKLGQIFNNPRRYKENITKPTYPNFSINQINLEVTPKGRTRLQLDYLMTIQYRVAQNTEEISNLQQQLDEIGLILTTELTELDLERPTKTFNRYYNKDEGVLHFFYSVRVFVIPEKQEEIKMQQLEVNSNI